MSNKKLKIILFTKRDRPTVKEAVGYLRKYSKSPIIYEGTNEDYAGTFDDAFPEGTKACSQDIIISYLSPWIIPADLLNKTKLGNINFHPGPPEYPGIGCVNFAIYNNEKTYGVTAHLMDEKVDSGKIIAVRRFPLLKSYSVFSLIKKSYEHMLDLFYKVMDFILKNNALPECGEIWKRAPYTRKELEELCKISPDAAKAEIKRRIKATSYPNMPGPYIELLGYKFEYNPYR